MSLPSRIFTSSYFPWYKFKFLELKQNKKSPKKWLYSPLQFYNLLCPYTHSILQPYWACNFLKIQFSRSVVSDSLRSHGLQHARLPSPSTTPGTYSNSCPLSWWCHPTILSSVVPFSSCLQSFPASESFPMSQIFAWGGQSTGATVSASVILMNIQDWFPLGLTGLPW